MRKFLLIFLLIFTFQANAQIPIADIIKEGIKKIIQEVDLKIQKFQNKTLWLQNIQRSMENSMTRLKLAEIENWTEKQRKLYDDYFEELKKVKSAISSFRRVKDIITNQLHIANEYKNAWSLLSRDQHFTTEELKYMQSIYSGILEESIKNTDQLFLAVTSFATQMTDAKRLEIINAIADKVEANLVDIKQFSRENKMLSLQRATEAAEINYLKKLYGL